MIEDWFLNAIEREVQMVTLMLINSFCSKEIFKL